MELQKQQNVAKKISFYAFSQLYEVGQKLSLGARRSYALSATQQCLAPHHLLEATRRTQVF